METIIGLTGLTTAGAVGYITTVVVAVGLGLGLVGLGALFLGGNR